MNIIGKTLVVLNLIFALVVGGFLVIDFATRTNWKTAYENLKREMVVAGGNYDISGRTLRDINTQVKRAEAENTELKRKLVEQETIAKVNEGNWQLKLQEEMAKAKDADLSVQKALAEKARLTEEAKGLTATVQNRDHAILDLQKDNKKIRDEAIAKELFANQAQERNENLLAQNQDLLRKLALREAGVGTGAGLKQDPNAPNPPSTYVKGKIERVDAQNRRLVQISLGTDQGIKLNHTLLVYRLSPDPQYLGMIRIVDAKEHVSVGQLVPGASGNRPLQAGDIVASSLSSQSP